MITLIFETGQVLSLTAGEEFKYKAFFQFFGGEKVQRFNRLDHAIRFAKTGKHLVNVVPHRRVVA